MKKDCFLIVLVLLTIVLSGAVGLVLIKPEILQLKAIGQSKGAMIDESEDLTFAEKTESQLTSWGRKDVYDGTEPIIRNMGETLYVTALKPREQWEKPPTRSEVFALWQGEMAFTVNSAVLYNTVEETGLNEDDFTAPIALYEEDGCKPLVIQMTIQNIDAKSNIEENPAFFSDGFLLSCKEEFNFENFLGGKSGISGSDWHVAQNSWLVYADPHSNGAYDYYSYYLEPGEFIKMTLCYYVKADAVPLNELYLAVQTNSNDHIFGIELNQLKEVE